MLASVAASQLALVTLAQARAVGLSDRAVAANVAAGRLERVGHGVLAVTGVPWTWERQVLAAVLAVGPRALVSHCAAAHLLGFDGFDEVAVELTVPRGRRARTARAVVHTTAHLSRLDVVRVGRFSATSATRTIVDLCAVGVGDEALAASIGSALRDGWTSEAFLRRRLAALRGPGRHGVRLLDQVLAGPMGHSHPERVFLRLLRQRGLPPPVTQVSLRLERVIRVDALWPAERLVVEVMGHRFHATKLDLQRDASRRNELQELGYLVLELTADDLAHQPAPSLDRVARNLARRRLTAPPV